MRDALAILASLALAMLIVAVAVFAGGDTAMFVPPPESVAEGFMRNVVAGRAREAMAQVEPSSSVSLATVTTFGEHLRSSGGAIDQVEGRPGSIDGSRATAAAAVSTEQRGEVLVELSMVRRRGLWRIIDWSVR